MTSKVIDNLVFLRDIVNRGDYVRYVNYVRDDNVLLMFYTKRIEAANMPFSGV